jgi:hypothetical protein
VTRRLVALALPIATLSCSLVVSTSGLEGASTPAATDREAGAADESGTAEAATPPDGGGDSSLEAGACADPALIVCERFDTATALARYPATTDAPTTVTSDDAVVFSAPRSAKFTIQPSGNGSPDATIRMASSVPAAHYVFEGYLHIERVEPQGVARLLAVGTGTGSTVYLEQSGRVMESSTLLAQLAPVPSSTWLLVRVEVRSDAPRSVSVTVGTNTTGVLPLGSTGKASEVLLDLGVSEAASPSIGWIVRWDDVSVRAL